uniref:Uncharacterized protein n=1 Tax=viral metagenome TaxID=1070528 RepID=A0A6C0KYC5_9ZZZZ|tara:strand:- start:3374 stop:3688 length:315 start_codon:yes stop_codon:yes gene_type:complete
MENHHHTCDKNCESGCCDYVDEEAYNEDAYDDYDYGTADKWRYSIYSALVFLLISNPYTYILVNKLLGNFVKISSSNGCPTMAGLFIHAVVFAVIIRVMMELDI